MPDGGLSTLDAILFFGEICIKTGAPSLLRFDSVNHLQISGNRN